MIWTHDALEDIRNQDVKIYINGELKHRDDAKISVFDSGYLVGDGIWEAFRLHQGTLVFLDKHLDRLWQGAATVSMNFDFSKEDLITSIWKTINANNMHDGVHIRVMVTRGFKKTPSQDPRLTISGPNLVIIAEHKIASEKTKENGITLFTSTIKRGSPDYLDPRLNCHSKIHEVQALSQAIKAGADEALMLDIHGFVSTCNATNFFIIKNNEVWTSTGEYCMNGITRENIILICEQNQIICKQKNFSLFDVYGANEAFVTGTFGGLTPVINIDGRDIGKGGYGDLTKKLSCLYNEMINKEVLKEKSNVKG